MQHQENAAHPAAADFRLTELGPLDSLLARVGLARPGVPSLALRAVLPALVAWVPLLVLALVRPPVGQQAAISFFMDYATHTRFLVVIPLLVLAEGLIGPRAKQAARQLVVSGLVPQSQFSRFQEAARKGRRLLESPLVEGFLALAAIGAMALLVRHLKNDGEVFWYEEAGPDGDHLTLAGWWNVLASPLVGFLFLRWLWRYTVWAWFLRQIARLDLQLPATHPDRAGGLGFMNVGQSSFAILAVAASSIVAASAASQILFGGAALKTYQPAVILLIVLSVIVGVAPLMAFTPPLARARRQGLLGYGEYAIRYVQAFERKWITGGADKDPMEASDDIQALADLGGSFERLDKMRSVAFDSKTMIAFAAGAAVPMIPLLLLEMPFREMVKLLIKAVV